MTDTEEVMTTDTAVARVEKSSSFLDHGQVEAALTYLEDCWPNHKMTPAQREAWTDVLMQLRHGELKAALARASNDRRFRPDPYPVLDVVLATRASDARDRVPAWNPPPPVDNETYDPKTNTAIIEAREALKRVGAQPVVKGSARYSYPSQGAK